MFVAQNRRPQLLGLLDPIGTFSDRFSWEYFLLCERTIRLRVTLRKSGSGGALEETPNGLGAARSCNPRPGDVNAIIGENEKLLKPQIARMLVTAGLPIRVP